MIYVPAPPPAASGSSASGGAIVIEQPAPAEPVVSEAKPELAPEPAREPSPHTTQRVVRRPTPTPPVANPQRSAADAPKLEPGTSSQQQRSIERDVKILQRAVYARIERLSRRNLAGADRKTLEDARTFIAQSENAMKAGDLTQSSNLAEKADLLVQAVEKQY